MNQLSWTLYLSDLLPNLGKISVLIFIMMAVIAVGMIVYGGILKDGWGIGDPVWVKGHKIQKNGLWLFVPMTILLAAGAAMPSKGTIQMIALSQVGEAVLQLEDMQEIGGEAGMLAKDTLSMLRTQVNEALAVKPSSGSEAN
jgi:hypothetical protein